MQSQWILALAALAFSSVLHAQEAPITPNNPTGAPQPGLIQPGQKRCGPNHVPCSTTVLQRDTQGKPRYIDFDNTPNRIFVEPSPDLPFTATIAGERAVYRAGNLDFTANSDIIARDSTGRIYQQRHVFAANGYKKQTSLTWSEYIDPNQNVFYNCVTKDRVCYRSPLDLVLEGPPLHGGTNGPTLGISPLGLVLIPEIKLKTIGQKNLDGLATTGYVAKLDIDNSPDAASQPGVPMNNTFSATSEFWYSDDLHADLALKFTTYQATHTYTLKDLQRSEPDPKLFELPAGYKIVDITSPHS